jgi:hypothetical protein
LSKASVSEVAANTTTVPVTFSAAAGLPDAALPDAAGLLGGELVVDELHAAASASTSTAPPADSRRNIFTMPPLPARVVLVFLVTVPAVGGIGITP